MLIAVVGEGYCFAIDAVSYVAVVVSLLMMRDLRAGRVKPPVQTSVLAELAEGFRYVSRFLPVRSSLLLLALVSLMGMPFTVLMPAVATQVLHGGPHLLGFLMASSGAGAVLGALYMASRKDVLGLDKLLPRAAGIFGLSLVAFGFARVPWVALPLLALVGGGFMVQMAATNTLIQTLVTEDLRGRVMAFYTMAFLGTAPLGSLLAGTVAARAGTSITITGGGIICSLGAVVFALRLPRIREAGRKVFLERGIMVAVETDANAHSV
jgi:MFS family permease